MFITVLVTGSRSHPHPTTIRRVLTRLDDSIDHSLDRMLLLHGGATGVDSIADRWASERDVQRVIVPANWAGEGKAAGPQRNGLMLDLLRPIYSASKVLAFPTLESKGTWDMVGRVWRTHDVEVYNVTGGLISRHNVEATLIEKGYLR